MAQLKQLSAGSSQIIMMMFRDKNNAPIKADSVHVKGSIFTGSGKPFEFEVNKGVCTNCKIQNDMLLFNIVPLLGLGQMQVTDIRITRPQEIYLWALKRVWLWLAIITHGRTPERQTLTKFKEIYWQRRTEL